MMQPHQTPKFIPVEINKGTLPDWNTRLGYPQIINFFVGQSGSLYTSPWLNQFQTNAPQINTRAMHISNYKGGSYFTVTNSNILQIQFNGTYKIIAQIKNSKRLVQITENIRGQIGITDGKNFYAYDQETMSFAVIDIDQITNPISCATLNNITIVLDGTTGKFMLSSPFNMFEFPVLDNVPTIESGIGSPLGIEILSNNIYFFGSIGIERWAPQQVNNAYLFPFSRDENFRQDNGALASNAITRGIDCIYYLSSKFTVNRLTVNSVEECGEPPLAGMAKIISEYTDIEKCEASFFTFRSNYFCALTFPDTGVCWCYCQNSNTWSFISDLIISSVGREGAGTDAELVATKDGLFQLSTESNGETKMRRFIGQRITNYKGLEPYRVAMNGFEVRMVQGLHQTVEPQFLELTFSIDSKSWLNTVKREIGRTGERNAIITWKTNISAYEFTPRVDYYGPLDITIEKMTAIVK